MQCVATFGDPSRMPINSTWEDAALFIYFFIPCFDILGTLTS